jgi:hypothetical protein
MAKWLRPVVVAAGLLLIIAITPAVVASPDQSRTPEQAQAAAPARLNQGYFRSLMRKLWEDHITYTRLFLVSAATLPTPLPDLDLTVARLLKNQVDIGNAVKRFYGTAAGNQLTALLKVHIETAAELVLATKAGDTPKATDASARWYANANDIAAFLHTANPDNWPLAALQTFMKDHLDHTLMEAAARIEGRFADDIAAFDMVHTQILKMADVLTIGIIRQFPDQFQH